jgi:erythromycin esterase-like protein
MAEPRSNTQGIGKSSKDELKTLIANQLQPGMERGLDALVPNAGVENSVEIKMQSKKEKLRNLLARQNAVLSKQSERAKRMLESATDQSIEDRQSAGLEDRKSELDERIRSQRDKVISSYENALARVIARRQTKDNAT